MDTGFLRLHIYLDIWAEVFLKDSFFIAMPFLATDRTSVCR